MVPLAQIAVEEGLRLKEPAPLLVAALTKESGMH